MRAFVVVHINTEASPPSVYGYGIYSTSAAGLKAVSGEALLDVISVEGEDRHDSYKRAMNELRAYEHLTWVVRLVRLTPDFDEWTEWFR